MRDGDDCACAECRAGRPSPYDLWKEERWPRVDANSPEGRVLTALQKCADDSTLREKWPFTEYLAPRLLAAIRAAAQKAWDEASEDAPEMDEYTERWSLDAALQALAGER